MKRSFFKRAVLAGLLAGCALALSGCAGGMEERPMADLSASPVSAPAPAPLQDGVADRMLTAALYYPDESGASLRPSSRKITATGGESRAQAALLALLDGPDTVGVFWPELGEAESARLIEISDGVATVDLPAHARTLAPEMLFAVRMAVANTLTEFSEISYVNVLIGGREEGLDLGATLPVGTLTREENPDVRVQYNARYDQRQNPQGVTLMTTLHFPSADGGLLLPQVRSISYAQASPIEYLYTLLGELGKGAAGALYCAEIPAPMEYIEQMPEIVRTADGYLAIDIHMNSSLDDALYACGLTRGIYLAMIADTLLGFVPGVEGMQVSIGGRTVESVEPQETPDGQRLVFEQGLLTREDFVGYTGTPVTLYAMDEHSDGLIRLERTVEQSRAENPRERLYALMRLSNEGIFALPDKVGEQDVLAVDVSEEMICVNLSAAFADALSKLGEAEERAAVYAMVNTLTEGRGAMKVAFYFEGEQIQTLAGGLEMRGVFVRNPGMVVN